MTEVSRTYLAVASVVGCLSALSCSAVLGLDDFEDADPNAPTGGVGAAGGQGLGGSAMGGSGATPAQGGGGAGTGGAPGGGGGTGNTGGTFCEPLVETQPCYTGPAGTLGEGICTEGLETCIADGSAFGPCEDDVVPQATDDCATSDDENCDGQPNEDCPCTPNEVAPCYTGPANTLGNGICVEGTQQCNALGTGFGPCTGDVIPQAETCNTPVDDDCDAMTNEEGAGCVCLPNTVDACYTGPASTQGVGICSDGTEQCNAQGTAYGPCNGQVLPGAEACLLVGDEDCDGSGCSERVWSLGAGNGSNQRGNDVAGDAAGNTYATGRFEGTINLGGSTLTSAGGSDIWLAKFSPTGTHVWSKRFGSAANESGVGIGVNAAGDVAITGYVNGVVNFGGGNLPYVASTDIFVAKFDTAGTHIWSKSFGDSTAQSGKDVAISPNGNVTVFGEYYTATATSSFNFGGANLPFAPPANQAGFLVQLASATGNHVWTRGMAFSASGFYYARSIAVDASGNIYAAGGYSGSLNDGCGTAASNTGYDAWVARYVGTTGACTWSNLYAGPDTATTEAIDVDSTGVYISGDFQDSLAVGTVNLNAVGTNENEIFVAKLAVSNGATTWAKRIGDSLGDNPGGVAAAPGGHMHVGGNFEGTINLGGANHTAVGLDDVFLARFDGAGVLVWSKSAGDAANQHMTRVGRDAQFNLLATGYNLGVINFGGLAHATSGGEDVFIVKIGH